MSTPRIFDAVFNRGPARQRRRGLIAAIAAGMGLHVGTVLWAVVSAPSLETWSAELATKVHAELTREEVVELPKPPVEKPQPPPSPPPPSPSAPRRAAKAPPSPAQAGKIVAADPAAPVDLPGTTFVTGSAVTYAGGVTSSSGKSRVAVEGPVAAAGAAAAPEDDRSSPVTIEDTDWRCPWPREADSQQIDEQSVIIQVLVRADGSAESAKVLSDPGHGFAAAARACALATRYRPARDRHGRTVRAESPPIRVHFTR